MLPWQSFGVVASIPTTSQMRTISLPQHYLILIQNTCLTGDCNKFSTMTLEDNLTSIHDDVSSYNILANRNQYTVEFQSITVCDNLGLRTIYIAPSTT